MENFPGAFNVRHYLARIIVIIPAYLFQGEPLADVNELYQENNDSAVLSWHPTKKLLTVGLISGDIQLWNGQSEFINIPSSHKSRIKILQWSELGTRLISIDEVINFCVPVKRLLS